MKLLSIVGVRPQFVKAAMVCAAVERFNQTKSARPIRHILVNTGQHYETAMAEVFFRQLPLPTPDYSLGVGSGTHGAQTGAMLEKIEKVLLKDRPDFVIVYGDTNSTLAGALAAVKLHIPVAHVEAGLRSFNRYMPEEINRIVADQIADVLLCPTHAAIEQLKREGVQQSVYFSGDVMLDAVKTFAALADASSDALSRLGIEKKQYVLATIHRAENTDSLERMSELVEILCSLDEPTIFAIHPRLRAKLERDHQYADFQRRLNAAQKLKIIPPLSYLDMLHLELHAQLILTDSGGVQKEAYFAGTPCLTLREETEWTETLVGGWNGVVGTSPQTVLPLAQSLCAGNGASPMEQPQLSAFGDGKAAERILEILLSKHIS